MSRINLTFSKPEAFGKVQEIHRLTGIVWTAIKGEAVDVEAINASGERLKPGHLVRMRYVDGRWKVIQVMNKVKAA